MLIISLQMMSRRDLTDLETELEDEVRAMNLFNAPQNIS
jgi:hypothetical protein